MDKIDDVYSEPLSQVKPFEFNARVADVFQNMIERSVPGYALVLDMIALLTHRFAQEGTHCYDLGCSLGASTLAIRQQLPASCKVIAVDNSQAMVARCQQAVARDHSQAPCDVLCQDIRDIKIENASIVVMNFTLQFIDDDKRRDILHSIARGLVPGGILILSEKVQQNTADQAELMTDIHHTFKKLQGYSDLEIAQKRTSLENVLVANSSTEHIDRLNEAGFTTATEFFRCLNFSAFLGIK